jgi:hypothetical protein
MRRNVHYASQSGGSGAGLERDGLLSLIRMGALSCALSCAPCPAHSGGTGASLLPFGCARERSLHFSADSLGVHPARPAVLQGSPLWCIM